MKFFETLKDLLPEGRATHFTIFKKGDQITVSMAPSAIKGEKDLGIEPDDIKPLNITGTVAELDAQFFDVIKAPQERIVKALTHNAAEVMASVDKAERPTTDAGKGKTKGPKIKEEKKEEPKQDSGKMIEDAAKLMKEKKWKDALALLEKAKAIDPKNKYIDADIKTCNQWIKAMTDADLFAADEPKVEPAPKAKAAPTPEPEPVVEDEPMAAMDDELDLPIDL